MVMATKSSTKTKTAVTKKDTTSKPTAQKHELLYIMSNQCGWCKKANPIVDELVKDGHKITTLDVMNPDESKRANEVKQKYNVGFLSRPLETKKHTELFDSKSCQKTVG